jgi:excisionase family DNA binding protein
MQLYTTSEPKHALSPNDFCRRYGIGKTQFYALLKAGQIKSRKLGRRTLVAASDAQAWFESLPVSKREAA